MDITSLYNVSSDVIKEAMTAGNTGVASQKTESSMFDVALNAAVENISTTNAYLSNKENEEIKWALGESENMHNLTIAMKKASSALQYTVAVRDKFMEAYREIMQIQI